MMTVTGARDAFGVHSLAYYRKAYDLFHPAGMAELLLAEYEGRPLAALMVFALGRRAYYLYGASTDEERNRMPTYLLQWRAMQWARAREEFGVVGEVAVREKVRGRYVHRLLLYRQAVAYEGEPPADSVDVIALVEWDGAGDTMLSLCGEVSGVV